MRSDILALVAGALLLAAPAARAAPLLGPAVGDVEQLLAEGRKLEARRKYADAAKAFLSAARAAPGEASAYLALGRSSLKARKVPEACHALRTFLRVAPGHEARPAAERELAACENQERAGRHVQIESREEVLRNQSLFAAALEAGRLDEAGASLRALVEAGLLGPELGEMARRLTAAALQRGEEIHGRALARERLDEATLRAAMGHYEIAATFAVDVSTWAGRRAFLEGVIELQNAARGDEARWQGANDRCTAATAAAPTMAEYAWFRALALWRSGDRNAAVDALERDLPGDPRTALLRATTAVEAGGYRGAAEVERLLFTTRYPGGN